MQKITRSLKFFINVFLLCVRWFSSTDAFIKFVKLLEPIKPFLIEEKKTFEILDNMNFSQDFLFLNNVMQNLQSLNLPLQGKEENISCSNYFQF